ncbi:MAG: hypothetical protein A2X36_04470, partial [Elusimicrobia bacterium GWA2_69_24]
FPAPVLAAGGEIEAKVALERSLEERLRAVLVKLLGTEDVLVMVNADVLSASEKAMEEIMPGVPIKETPGGSEAPKITRTSVRSITVTVLVDASTADADVETIRKTTSDVLSLEEARGDRVRVQKAALTRRLRTRDVPIAKLLDPAWIVSVLWLLFVCAALALIYSRFLTPLLTVMRTMTALRSESAAPKPSAEAAAGLPAPAEVKERSQADEEEAGDGEELPFAFIRERHLPMLKYLLRKAQPRTAAVIAHYLPPRMAAELLTSLSAEARQEVVSHMSRVVQLDEENVLSIEDSLRSRIEYLMGGEDKLASILGEVPSDLQTELLEAVRRSDPKMGATLDRRIVRLEDLVYLESNDLKNLSRRVPIRSLAAVLKSSPSIRDRILPKLTTGLGAWLAQEVSLSSDLPAERVAEEQRKVLAALSQLLKEGVIILKKDVPAVPAETPALPDGTADASPVPGPESQG